MKTWSIINPVNPEEEVLLNKFAWQDKILALCEDNTLYENSTTDEPLTTFEIINLLPASMLKSCIEQIQSSYLFCRDKINHSFVEDLYSIGIDDLFFTDENGKRDLTYNEAKFISRYETEVAAWLPYVFEVVVKPNSQDLENFIYG